MTGPGLPKRARDKQSASVDLIVPVRNEAENIESFLVSIDALHTPPGVTLSLIFVEDGSRDGTVELLRTISQTKPGVRFYSIQKGFGEGPAIVFGLSRSNADAMIMMAVESHPPELIPAMIQGFLRGAEVVQCVRDSFTGRSQRRDAMTALFPFMIRLLTGFEHDAQNVYYRLVSRDFARVILDSPRFWRFIRFPLPDPDTGALEVVHADMRERDQGESTYGILRLTALGADGILAWMSTARFLTLTLTCATLAVFLVAAGLTALAVGMVVLLIPIVSRYIWIRRVDCVKKMVVLESSDDPREGPPAAAVSKPRPDSDLLRGPKTGR